MVKNIKKSSDDYINVEIRYIFNNCVSGYCYPYVKKIDSELLKNKVYRKNIKYDHYLSEIVDVTTIGGGASNLGTYKSLFSDAVKMGKNDDTTVVIYNPFVCFTDNIDKVKDNFDNENTFFRGLFSQCGENVTIWDGYKDYKPSLNEYRVLAKLLHERESGQLGGVNIEREIVENDAEPTLSKTEPPVPSSQKIETAQNRVEEPKADSKTIENSLSENIPQSVRSTLHVYGFSSAALGVHVVGYIEGDTLYVKLFYDKEKETSHKYEVVYGSNSTISYKIGTFAHFKYDKTKNKIVVMKIYDKNIYNHEDDPFNVWFKLDNSDG